VLFVIKADWIKREGREERRAFFHHEEHEEYTKKDFRT
jgi:hypothetical protein